MVQMAPAVVIKRDSNGRILPGQGKLPGGGRPAGFQGLALEVRRRTNDGQELVEWVLNVFRNPAGAYTNEFQWKALEWLSDRGFGKPVQAIDLHQSAEPHSPQVDVSGMADADLAALVQVLELATGQGEVEDFGNAIDAQCVEE